MILFFYFTYWLWHYGVSDSYDIDVRPLRSIDLTLIRITVIIYRQPWRQDHLLFLFIYLLLLLLF